MMLKSISLALVLCAAGITVAYGDINRYVINDDPVTERTGTSTQHKILRMLHTGVQVDLLESDNATGYSRIRSPDGTEGWVLTRYLSDTPAPQAQLDDAKKKLVNLEIENNRLNDALHKVKGDNGTMQQQQQSLSDTNRRLQQELASIKQTAANALAIDHENKTLKGRLVNMERQVQTYGQENATLKDRRTRDWFIAGALVLGGGIVLGLVIPRLRVRRRSSWDTL